MPRRALLRLTGGAALGVLVPRRLLGAELNQVEQLQLANNYPIRVPLELDLPQGSYFGGLVYQRVGGAVDDVMKVAADPTSYTSILSRTREARVLSRSGRDMHVYLRHGEGFMSVSQVMLVRREAANLIRFWVDRSAPHDVDDGWGFLRADPWSTDWIRFECRLGGAPIVIEGAKAADPGSSADQHEPSSGARRCRSIPPRVGHRGAEREPSAGRQSGEESPSWPSLQAP
jgi:hypothetical protein